MANTPRSRPERPGSPARRPGRGDDEFKPDLPYPATPPPARSVRPPSPLPRPPGVRLDEDEGGYGPLGDLRDDMIAARERRSPEGLSTTKRGWWMSVIVLAVFAAVMVLAIALALARYFGWAALAVGMLLVLLYAVIGGGSEWLAARLRVREGREIEEEVTVQMKDFERPPPDAPE